MQTNKISATKWQIVDDTDPETVAISTFFGRPGMTEAEVIASYAEAKNPPAPSEAQLRQLKFSALSDLRWQRETGGLDLTGGARIVTTRESQAQIAATVQSISAGMISEPIDWKLASGWQQLTTAQILAIAGAVAAHVKACFAAERAVSEQMDLVTGDLSGFDIKAAFDAAYSA
ncbi:DUF4376 domain-containing protein [Thalassovita sp.]|uniref:DUF4376 domain-containing protein n=1 Tax=Thalassovita sp. TaxID=1979401 RepID=UPI002B2789F6|nr:DUF4376 domain-containing protein [Thalassovita sp.]